MLRSRSSDQRLKNIFYERYAVCRHKQAHGLDTVFYKSPLLAILMIICLAVLGDSGFRNVGTERGFNL